MRVLATFSAFSSFRVFFAARAGGPTAAATAAATATVRAKRRNRRVIRQYPLERVQGDRAARLTPGPVIGAGTRLSTAGRAGRWNNRRAVRTIEWAGPRGVRAS